MERRRRVVDDLEGERGERGKGGGQ